MSTKIVETVIEPVVLSISQAGAYLSVSPDTMRRLIRNGTVPHARIGNSIRIRRSDLDGYLEHQVSRQWQPVEQPRWRVQGLLAAVNKSLSNEGQVRPDAALTVRRHCDYLVACGLLLLAVALIFGQTVLYNFVNYDDDVLVYDNPMIARGVTAQGVGWAFTTSVANMWYPLTWISYMLDSQIYGPKPWGFHLTNVLLHAATTVVLFSVLRRMSGNLWASALVALLFAIHPLRVEAVAWVGERKSPLSGLFFVSTIAAYIAYARRPFSLVRYLAVAGLFTLGLLAKPTLVTLPFVLLLLDYWPLGRTARIRDKGLGMRDKRLGTSGAQDGLSSLIPHRSSLIPPVRLVVEKIPLLLLSVACCVAAVLSQGPTSSRSRVCRLLRGSRIP